jgi:hypothetical protein
MDSNSKLTSCSTHVSSSILKSFSTHILSTTTPTVYCICQEDSPGHYQNGADQPDKHVRGNK